MASVADAACSRRMAPPRRKDVYQGLSRARSRYGNQPDQASARLWQFREVNAGIMSVFVGEARLTDENSPSRPAALGGPRHRQDVDSQNRSSAHCLDQAPMLGHRPPDRYGRFREVSQAFVAISVDEVRLTSGNRFSRESRKRPHRLRPGSQSPMGRAMRLASSSANCWKSPPEGQGHAVRTSGDCTSGEAWMILISRIRPRTFCSMSVMSCSSTA